MSVKDIVDQVCADSLYDAFGNILYMGLPIPCCDANETDTANCLNYDICPGNQLLTVWYYLQQSTAASWSDCDSLRFEIMFNNNIITTSPYVAFNPTSLYSYLFSSMQPGDYWIRASFKGCDHVIGGITHEMYRRIHVLDLPASTPFSVVDFYNPTDTFHNNDTICIDKEFKLSYYKDPRFNYDVSFAGTTNIGSIWHGNPTFYTYFGKNPGYTYIYLKTYNVCDTVVDSLKLYFKTGLTIHADTVCLGQPTTLCASYDCDISQSYSITQGITSWNWNFGDSTTQKTYDSCTTHLYTIAGTYNVTVSVDSIVDNYLGDYVNLNEIAHFNVVVGTQPNIVNIIGSNNNCDSITSYSVINQNGFQYEWAIESTWGNIVGANSGNSVIVHWNSFTSIDSLFSWITIKVFNGYCYSIDSLRIFNCCYHGESMLFSNDTINSAITINNMVSINGRLVINADVIFSNTTINMGPESSIFIIPQKSCAFYNCNITAKPCGWMWDGIYVPSNFAHLIIDTNCIIRDAINAVVSLNNGQFEIANSTFLENYKNIVLKNYFPNWGMPYPHIPHPGIIYGCTFSGNMNGRLSLSPHVNHKTQSGIEASSIYELNIGDESQVENNFTMMKCGIFSDNSNINVYNNRFDSLLYSQSIGSSNPSMLFTGTAIHSIVPLISTLPSGTPLNKRVNVGGTGNRKNTFINCEKGVYTYKANPQIVNNTFENIGIGIENRCEKKMDGLIRDNYMNSVDIGIKAMSIPGGTCDYRVEHNTIYYPATIGINIRSLGSIFISATNYDKVNVLDNYIYFREEDYNTKPKWGILAEGSMGINVGWNHVVKEGGVPEEFKPMYGISINQSQFAVIHDNHPLQRLGAGMRTAGSLSGTMFFCNNMIDDYWGMYFDASSYIDDQGDSSHANYNQWTGNYNDSINAGYRKMGKDSTIIFTNKNWYFPNGQLEYNPEVISYYPLANHIIGVSISTISNNCSAVIHSTPPFEFSEMGRQELFEAIINDEKYYGELQEEYSYLDKEALYFMLEKDSSLLFMGENDDYKYEAFLDSLANTDIQILNEIDRLIKEDSIAAATLLARSIPNQNLYQQTLSITLNIYLATFALGLFDLTETQYDSLYTIANLSPYLAGPGVYIARNMLDLNPHDLGLPFSLHPDSKKIHSGVKLYPNPAKESVTIEWIGVDIPKQARIKLFDISGRLLFEKRIDITDNYSTINLGKINTGIYQLKITSLNGNTIANVKLMINQ